MTTKLSTDLKCFEFGGDIFIFLREELEDPISAKTCYSPDSNSYITFFWPDDRFKEVSLYKFLKLIPKPNELNTGCNSRKNNTSRRIHKILNRLSFVFLKDNVLDGDLI